MNEIPDSSVALVVTSPPYFAGKEYEEALGEGTVPATYLEYLDLLRDVFAETERVVVASKGRFDRTIKGSARAGRQLPSESSMTRDDFMENTLDVWEIPAESATTVGHPAPLPVHLSGWLIEPYTCRGDLVFDPFAGSGTTAVAAVRSGRHFVAYGLDESYVKLSEASANPAALWSTSPPGTAVGTCGSLSRVLGPNRLICAVIEILGQSGLEDLRGLCDGKCPGSLGQDETSR